MLEDFIKLEGTNFCNKLVISNACVVYIFAPDNYSVTITNLTCVLFLGLK